jgi:hypothetical protein
MMPTAELLVMETTRSAACPKQLSTKRNRREGMTVSFIEACFPCQEYSMGLKLTTRDPENFGLLILGFAGGTAGWPACRAVGQLRGWVE